MRIRQPYTLFKRTSKDHGEVRFVSYYGPDGLRHKESTGENNKAKAQKRNAQQESTTLREFSKPFFVWDECSWIKRQIAKGRGCNKQWAHAKRKMLEKHVLPKFGSLRLQQISRPAVESWLVGLPLSNQTRNHVLCTLKTVLSEAQAQGYLERNPLEHAEPMGKQYRKRDVFESTLANCKQPELRDFALYAATFVKDFWSEALRLESRNAHSRKGLRVVEAETKRVAQGLGKIEAVLNEVKLVHPLYFDTESPFYHQSLHSILNSNRDQRQHSGCALDQASPEQFSKWARSDHRLAYFGVHA